MVILKQNVRTKAGLLPAGTDVEGKLSGEVVEDLIKTGLASRPSEKLVSDSNPDDDQTDTDIDESKDSNEEDETEQTEDQEDEQPTDDVDLNLPDTGATTKTTTRGRGKRSKS